MRNMSKRQVAYVRSNQMMSEVLISMQHHGQADLIPSVEKYYKEEKKFCECGAMLVDHEIELGMCSKCHMSENAETQPRRTE